LRVQTPGSDSGFRLDDDAKPPLTERDFQFLDYVVKMAVESIISVGETKLRDRDDRCVVGPIIDRRMTVADNGPTTRTARSY
jgi:hypothetical protein